MTEKLDVARELAKSVSYGHTFGFVHKDVRPETVLTLEEAKTSSRSTFLVGFGNFHRKGRTYLRNDGDWTKVLYRHPKCQGSAPRTDYIMQHDIFSLGVCLLEIGLWRSFVSYHSDSRQPILLEALGLIFDGIHIKYPARVKDKFIEMAHIQLPAYMVSRYAQVVHTCLTCLGPENIDFGPEAEFPDEDGIRFGVGYVEKESDST